MMVRGYNIEYDLVQIKFLDQVLIRSPRPLNKITKKFLNITK